MLKGRCGCGVVVYKLASRPMLVHCCHCLDCQRQTGSAYVLNAIIESDRVEVNGPVSEHNLPTPSGKGQIITRCRECGVALFSKYMIRDGKISYVRVGTLEEPGLCPPDVQIFTASKQPWVPLSKDIPCYEEFYSFAEVWPEKSLARRKAALAYRGSVRS